MRKWLGRPQVSRRILLASKGCSVGPTSRPREHGPWEWLRPKRVVTPHISRRDTIINGISSEFSPSTTGPQLGLGCDR